MARMNHPDSASDDFTAFREALRDSFRYIMRKKKNPMRDSTTSMYIYGLGFDRASLRPRRTSAIRAIGTELSHLFDVKNGGVHNKGLKPGMEQICDEINDMFRYLFIMMITNDFLDFDGISWIERFEHGFRSLKGKAEDWPHVAREMRLWYEELLKKYKDIKLNQSMPRCDVKNWIETQVGLLGMTARCSGVTVRNLVADLRARLAEKKDAPNSTTQNVRIRFPSDGLYFVFRAYIPDRPGSYTALLRQFQFHEFDVWASNSSTIVWGETAEVTLLVGFDLQPREGICILESEVERRVELIRESKLGDPHPLITDFCNNLVISLWEMSRGNVKAHSEKAFMSKISEAMNIFKSICNPQLATKSGKPAKLFYCYSRADVVLRNKLDKHMDDLREEGIVYPWHDEMIAPGEEWDPQLESHLKSSDIILLLISPSFMKSDYCRQRELPIALKRHHLGAAQLLPVLLRPTKDWRATTIGRLKALPSNGKAVTEWANPEAALADIVQSIKKLIKPPN